MAQLSKRLEHIVRKELASTIIPVKTPDGILVGDVLIASLGSIKNIYRDKELLYKEIHLNAIAIKIANLLAFRQGSVIIESIYAADQEYGKWFTDSQMLRAQYQKALTNQDFNRADMLWARYLESRDKTTNAKTRAESLIKN
jgi:hypothetical protein